MSTETVYGGTSDRYIAAYEWGNYAAAQGGANAYLDPLANEDAGVGQLTFGGSYYCEEFFFAVDLSGYDADGTASDAALSLYARDGSQQTDFPVTYEAYAYDWGAAVDTGDWRTPTHLGSMTLLASKTYTASGQVVTNAYTAFTSNSTNLASAVEAALGGTLRLMLTTSNFRLGDAPSGISDHIVWWTADHGSGYQPRIVFEYTAAASGNETSVAATLGTLASAATLTNTPPARSLSGAAALGTLASAATLANTPPARAASAAVTFGSLSSAASLNNGPPARATSAALTFTALATGATLANVPPARSGAVSVALGALVSGATLANVPPARATTAALDIGALVSSAVLANVPPARTASVDATLGSLLAAATVANTTPTRAASVLAQLGALVASGALANVPPARAVSVAATLGALTTAGELDNNVAVLSAALTLGALTLSAAAAWAYYSETGLVSAGRTAGLTGASDGDGLTGAGATRGLVSV